MQLAQHQHKPARHPAGPPCLAEPLVQAAVGAPRSARRGPERQIAIREHGGWLEDSDVDGLRRNGRESERDTRGRFARLDGRVPAAADPLRRRPLEHGPQEPWYRRAHQPRANRPACGALRPRGRDHGAGGQGRGALRDAHTPHAPLGKLPTRPTERAGHRAGPARRANGGWRDAVPGAVPRTRRKEAGAGIRGQGRCHPPAATPPAAGLDVQAGGVPPLLHRSRRRGARVPVLRWRQTKGVLRFCMPQVRDG